MTLLSRLSLAFLFTFGLSAAFAQSNVDVACLATAVPPVVRGEGITERVGDIVLECKGGSPNARITGNLSVFLNVNITNRLSGNSVLGIVLTADSGSGPQPIVVPALLTGPGTLMFNNVSFTLSPAGTVSLRLANVRAAANQLNLTPGTIIFAFLGFNSSSLVNFTSSQFKVGTPLPSLFVGFSSKLVCAPSGSSLPSTVSFSNFINSHAIFATTRVTEGFAHAFAPLSSWESLNADTGTRILVRYGGFPAGAQLYVPDVVAGSDALQPTAGGDFGPPPSGGQYRPTVNGTLLLARVSNADSNGAGGVPVYTPGPVGSGAVAFDSVSFVPLNGGSGYAVYEVVDANPSVQESAQFPTFLGLQPSGGGPAILTTEDVFIAPVSTVSTANPSAPIPRFQAVVPGADCKIVGDCGANYFPLLTVDAQPLQFTAAAGSVYQVGYFRVLNDGGGLLRWSIAVNYQNGSDWIRLYPSDGVNNSTVRVDVHPENLAAGTYRATLTIDAGPVAGTRTVPVTLIVTPGTPLPPQAQPPSITAVVNAASFVAGAVTPGSLASIVGSKLAGTAVKVAFDEMPAKLLYTSDAQINLMVPNELAAKQSANLVVTVDGISSTARTVPLAPFTPAIFPGAVLNQDYSVNNASTPAHPGDVIQIFATGLSGAGTITARINGSPVNVPYYAGPAPGLAGVQQVDLLLPSDLPGVSADVSVCGVSARTPDQTLCSAPAKVVLAQP
jgi:uncharacterized protein (TIGR03437 family)